MLLCVFCLSLWVAWVFSEWIFELRLGYWICRYRHFSSSNCCVLSKCKLRERDRSQVLGSDMWLAWVWFHGLVLRGLRSAVGEDQCLLQRGQWQLQVPMVRSSGWITSSSSRREPGTTVPKGITLRGPSSLTLFLMSCVRKLRAAIAFKVILSICSRSRVHNSEEEEDYKF